MILDKLVEKKDLEAYLSLRADFLKSEMDSEIQKLKPQDREFIRERFKGRISELNQLSNTIKQDTMKRDSKWCYKQLHKNDGLVSD